MQAQVMEFMKNFYEVFPEYRTVDVWNSHEFFFLVQDSYSLPDLPCWREFCGTMDTLHRYINPIR